MMHHELPRAIGLGLLLSGLLFSTGARAEKIAFIDMQRALAETTEGKAALNKLQGDADKKKKELESRKNEIMKQAADLEKQRTVLKAEALAQKQTELQDRASKLQEAAFRADQDLAKAQETATRPILVKVQRVIESISKRDNFTVVLNAQAVIWPQNGPNDITNEVIRKANEQK